MAEIALENRRFRRPAILSTLAAPIAPHKPPSMNGKVLSLYKSA
jgi:hypothetical protein